MADETPIEASAATETPAPTLAEKKSRKPRTPKAVSEGSTVDATSASVEKPAKKTRAKRGSKVVPVKAEKPVATPKAAASRAPRVAAAASGPVATYVDVIDDIADLIKLEEENKQLRKELSEKLRAENADLRKRLGQG
ncbi:SyrB-like regulator (plasmid) [Agrobacterium fabrum]|uniref:SyrB-like regulator n=1 Tax=Agrobacterium fabrum TaxID=1176649 RepID=UPI0015733358|nr:SyrB-like regulator [Agrobacterium fabrum]NTB10594.1 SyrB-like regulator [Agrobacterium fabrum]